MVREFSPTPNAELEPSAVHNERSGGSQVDPKEEISRTFQKYRAALLEADGDTAWALLDSHTTKFYSQVLEDALSIPRSDLQRLGFVHKFTVLRLRLEFRRQALQRLTGQSIFVLAVTNGWISRSEVQSLESLDKVTVDGRYATAYLPQTRTIGVSRQLHECGYSACEGFAVIWLVFVPDLRTFPKEAPHQAPYLIPTSEVARVLAATTKLRAR
jgi:hypothetical protein